MDTKVDSSRHQHHTIDENNSRLFKIHSNKQRQAIEHWRKQCELQYHEPRNGDTVTPFNVMLALSEILRCEAIKQQKLKRKMQMVPRHSRLEVDEYRLREILDLVYDFIEDYQTRT